MVSKSAQKKRDDSVDAKLSSIQKDVRDLKYNLIEHIPEHFSSEHILITFFGSLLIGLTFMFKGRLIDIGLHLPWLNVIAIIITTLIILTCEIYFIGYRRVSDKKSRPFFQFWAKRLFATYSIALLVSFFLAYLFNLFYFAQTFSNFIKLVVVLSMPCALGAIVSQMFKKL